MFTPEAIAGYTDTALFTVINLLVTYFVLKRFLFKPILKVLRTRQEHIEKLQQETQEKQVASEHQMAEATRRIQLSNREATEIITTAKSQAEVQSESILSDARKEATAMVARADGEIGRMRVTMINEVRDEVADLSVAIASKVIGQAMNEQRQRELVEQFIDESSRTIPTESTLDAVQTTQNTTRLSESGNGVTVHA